MHIGSDQSARASAVILQLIITAYQFDSRQTSTFTALIDRYKPESCRMTDAFETATYGGRDVGYGERPAVLVVDFQRGFTDPAFTMGKSPRIHAARDQTAELLQAARKANIPVASCTVGCRLLSKAYTESSATPKTVGIALFSPGCAIISSPGIPSTLGCAIILTL